MADSTTPLINGRAYDWSMIEIYFGFASSSEAIYGIKAVKWERKRKVESNYGIGSQPISRGYGNWTYTASIELDYATQVMFQEASPRMEWKRNKMIPIFPRSSILIREESIH